MQRSLVIPFSLIALLSTTLAAAQSPSSNPHPRIWLDAETRASFEAQSAVAGSAVARGAARCRAARENPASYSTGGWQGFEFVFTLSGCLISWVGSHDDGDLATAIKYWTVLLDDYQDVGDGLGGDTVVTHDTGYAMRTFAPYSALAYDWLHDAPGVTESLRARSRSRFDAWSSYYTTSGYLRDMPGANYQAGYLFAATLMAIAEAGEAGAAGDAHWATVRDVIWGRDMTAALAAGGVLDGGDWPEGWQYGPLSVLEYSLAARALVENGTSVPNVEAWASSLVTRFAHGLTPAGKAYTAGDTEDDVANPDPTNGALLAAIAGPANEASRAWARSFGDRLALENENPLFDALAAARGDASEPFPSSVGTGYLAAGAGNFYVRGSWASDAAWSTFQCSRRLVDDHQHNDAGNFVLSRGADDLVVDPSPYGTLSTLTGNAPAIDSAVVPTGYSPSQANWGKATALAWTKLTTSGVAIARCDYGDQFRFREVPSDVPTALRDFVFVPNGGSTAVVLVDRAVTSGTSRALHLRVRTPIELALAGNVATGSTGGSSLAIDRLWATSGTPTVRVMPKASECSSSNRTCDVSRLSGMEYRTDVAGPNALAVHVVTATASGQAVPRTMFSGAGYRGVLVGDGDGAVAVVTNDAADAALGSSLVYRVPARRGALHVVLDAPVDAQGKSDVTARLDGAECEVTVTPSATSASGFDGRPLVVRFSETCTPSEDLGQPNHPGAGGGDGGTGGAAGNAGTTNGGSAGTAGASGAPDDSGSEPSNGGGTSAGGSTTTAAASRSSSDSPSSAGPGAGDPATDSSGCSVGKRDAPAPWWLAALALALLYLVRSRPRNALSRVRPRPSGSSRSGYGARSPRETRR